MKNRSVQVLALYEGIDMPSYIGLIEVPLRVELTTDKVAEIFEKFVKHEYGREYTSIRVSDERIYAYHLGISREVYTYTIKIKNKKLKKPLLII